MESKYYLHKKSNRLVIVTVTQTLKCGTQIYFIDYVAPPFSGRNMDGPSFNFLVKLGNFVPVTESTAQVLYGS